MIKDVNKLMEFIGEKYRGLFEIMYSATDDLAPASEQIKKLTERYVDATRFNEVLYKTHDLIKFLGLSIYPKEVPMPLVTVGKRDNLMVCDVIIVNTPTRMKFNVTTEYEPWGTPSILKAELSILTEDKPFESFVYTSQFTEREKAPSIFVWKYYYNQPLLYLLLLYKFTTISDQPDVKKLIERYGLWDVISYLSKVRFTVKYPIYDEALSIFDKSLLENRLDKSNSNRLGCKIVDVGKDVTRDVLKRTRAKNKLISLSLITRETFGSIVRSLTFTTSGYSILYTYRGLTDRTLLPKELIELIDETVFALAYYAELMGKLYDYLRGKVT